jgi:nucleoid DNA-binding protein
MATKPAKKLKKPTTKKPATPVKKAVPAKKSAPKAAPTKSAPKVKPAKPSSPAVASGQKTRSIVKPKSPTGAYTQSEFLEHIRLFCGLDKRSEAKELTEDLAQLIKETLRKGYKIPFLGLGKMYVRQSKARTGKNPQTGEEIQIPAKKRVRFTPAKALKEAVM